MIKQLNLYCAVGAINFAVCVLIMALLRHYGCHYLLYTFGGYSAAICCSYLLNSRYTFEYHKMRLAHFIQFAIVNGSNLLLVAGIEALLIEHYNTREQLAVMIGMVWYTLVGFIVNQRIVFQRD